MNTLGVVDGHPVAITQRAFVLKCSALNALRLGGRLTAVVGSVLALALGVVGVYSPVALLLPLVVLGTAASLLREPADIRRASREYIGTAMRQIPRRALPEVWGVLEPIVREQRFLTEAQVLAAARRGQFAAAMSAQVDTSSCGSAA